VRPLVIAHRGASWDLPGNTLPAIERAIDVGADFVEIDVHPLDDRLVVVHGVPERTRPYPTLDQVVELTSGRIGLMVELKRPYRYRHHDVVRRALDVLDDEAILVCFEKGALLEAQRLRPRVRRLQHVGFGVSISVAARYAWGVGFGNRRATSRGIARAQALGLATTVFTVNSAARMRQLAGYGVTGIFTDRPDLMRRTLARPPTDPRG
jgi:glycerophosphoryl diester phosphodiesterase